MISDKVVCPNTLGPPKDPVVCPITLGPPEDPVIGSDGISYDKNAGTKWFENRTSPVTRQYGYIVGDNNLLKELMKKPKMKLECPITRKPLTNPVVIRYNKDLHTVSLDGIISFLRIRPDFNLELAKLAWVNRELPVHDIEKLIATSERCAHERGEIVSSDFVRSDFVGHPLHPIPNRAIEPFCLDEPKIKYVTCTACHRFIMTNDIDKNYKGGSPLCAFCLEEQDNAECTDRTSPDCLGTFKMSLNFQGKRAKCLKCRGL